MLKKKKLISDAHRAFSIVVNAYAAPSGLSAPSDPIHKSFHFVEANRWNYYLKNIARFYVSEGRSTTVEGVTHSYGTTPKIGINLGYFTFATLLHESIHFFSHYAFRKAFSVNELEGATEYLTRQLLNDFGPRRDVNGQGDIYAKEVALFLSINENRQDLEHLCQAYFMGNDIKISLIKNNINMLRNV